ncbi:MAG: PKD domain-containing protein [Planctomycetota bacterium]
MATRTRSTRNPKREIRNIVLVLALIVSSLQAADTWFNSAWPLRRTVTVTDVGRGGKLRSVAYATVPTLGKCNSAATDIRVVNDAGKEVKSLVVSAGFDDHALVAFEAQTKGVYKLYFGNPSAKEPAIKLEPDAGLVLEVRELGEGAPTSWDDTQKLIQNSKVLGRALWPHLEVNFNPFGAPDKGIYIQSATLDIPVTGTYGFQSNASAASFILIDGKLAVDWPGWHNTKGRKQQNTGQLELTAGAHKIQYVNVFNAHGACLAGWQKPGDKGFTPIPTAAFAGYLIAQVGPAETKTGPIADFDWHIADDLGMEGRAVTSVQFNTLTKGKVVKWDFGDGAVSFMDAPVHVYIEPGVYNVVCEIDGKKAEQKVLARPIHGHRGKQYEKRISEYAAIIHDYPTDGLSASACFELALICHEAQRFEGAQRGFRAAFEKGYVPKNADEFQWLPRLYEMYRDAARYDDAMWVCDFMVKTAKSDDVAAMALNLKAEIQFDYMDNVNAAQETCKTVLATYAKSNTDHVRMAYIRTGEYALVRGDREQARKIFDDAQKSDKWKKWTGDIDVTEGAHELNFTQYMRQREFDGAMREIISWEWKTPSIKLTGQTRCMRGRLLIAKLQNALAVKEFERAHQADPKAPFGDEILFYKGAAYEGLKAIAKSKECYAKVIKEFPESSLAVRAKEKLK